MDRFFTEVFVMADDARLQDRAADADGGASGPDSFARGHFGNRFSDGVDVIDGKEARTQEVHRKAGRPKTKAASKAGPKARRSRRPQRSSAAAKATAAKAGKYVYFFGRKTDGNGSMKPLLGGKGANLAEMCRIGLPVPPGFTITTEVCTYYYANKRTYPPALRSQMEAGHRGAREADRQDVR